MTKKIISVLFAIVLCFCTVLPALAADDESVETGFTGEYNRVQDLADVLSQEDYDRLSDLYDEIAERQHIDIVFCITNNLNGATPKDYAIAFYEKFDFGYGDEKDGIILLLSLDSRDWRIETRGRAIKIFNDSEIQSIGSRLKLDLTNNNYAAAAESFADICDEDITAYNERAGGVLPPPLWIAVAIVAGIVVAFVIVHSMKSKLKTVKMQAAAGSYLKSGSLNITQSNDIFLYSNVTRTAKPKENSSSGSSTHTSSSGNTYGGGGGKF